MKNTKEYNEAVEKLALIIQKDFPLINIGIKKDGDWGSWSLQLEIFQRCVQKILDVLNIEILSKENAIGNPDLEDQLKYRLAMWVGCHPKEFKNCDILHAYDKAINIAKDGMVRQCINHDIAPYFFELLQKRQLQPVVYLENIKEKQ